MDEPAKTAESSQDEGSQDARARGVSDRTVGNLALFGIFVVIVGIGAWLVFALDDARKADNCMSQGRRNCAPIDARSP